MTGIFTNIACHENQIGVQEFSTKSIVKLQEMLGNLTTDSKKQQLEIQDLKERLLSEDTISTFEKNRTLSEKIEEVKLMLEATSTSNL